MTQATTSRALTDGQAQPVRRRIQSSLHPIDAALTLRDQPRGFALSGSWFDGGAVLGADPRIVVSSDTHAEPFTLLDRLAPVQASQPGVYGGWVGYLGYQTGNLIERLPGSPPRPRPLPTWWLAWHDNVVRFDPDTGWWFEALAGEDDDVEQAFEQWKERLCQAPAPRPRFSCRPFEATPSGHDHRKAVRRALDLIAAGDIYQANVCLRLSSTVETGAAIDLFATGVEATTPQFGAFLDIGDQQAVASLSPELFLRRRDRSVTTMPIKGTRRRVEGEEHDLDTSIKDRAENVMIVDLMRNDLGRVCAPGSISVPRLFDVEAHPGVWHLVSEVQGSLVDHVGDGALLRATMPPGSVTGAPKVRAMETIAEVEATGREVYTGAIGMVSPIAGAEWSVAIRTFELSGDDVWMGVGGGIVADSDPADELAECLTKAAPLLRAIGADDEVLGLA